MAEILSGGPLFAANEESRMIKIIWDICGSPD